MLVFEADNSFSGPALEFVGVVSLLGSIDVVSLDLVGVFRGRAEDMMVEKKEQVSHTSHARWRK